MNMENVFYKENDVRIGLVLPDSDIGKLLLFTSDKFIDGSYLWLREDTIFLSNIISRKEHQRNVYNLLLMISSCGYDMTACCVSNRMANILYKFGFVENEGNFMFKNPYKEKKVFYKDDRL